MDDSRIDKLMRRPYKEWIKFNIIERSPKDLKKESIEIMSDLPDDIHKLMPEFMDTLLKLFIGNRKIWKMLSMDVAGSTLALARENIPSISNYEGEDFQLIVGNIFIIVTFFISARAAESPELRKMIGIKLRLFSR